MKLRSPSGATRTPIRPVRAPGTRTARAITPSVRRESTSARPAASRPTAVMRLERAPRRASHRAVFAAEPPWTSATRPGTSVPDASAIAGASTTSSIRSPSTTTLAGAPCPPFGAGRPGRVARVGRLGSRGRFGRLGRTVGGISGGYLGRGYNDRTRSPHELAQDAPEATTRPIGASPMTVATDLAQLAIDAIRTLSIDAVQKANSGHPGAPMGAAPMAYVVWTRFLRHAPTHPEWPDRDRFVLSAGHASMLLYSLLHLTGYDVSIDDLKAFRQWGSKTPGHPEFGLTPGVEATTGPLGQGFTNAVGMAIAEARLAAEFNRPGHDIVDHWTYTVCSDGDLQEGIASEAASLAGHLRLRKLVAVYDDNHIQLDGPTSMAWSEDVVARFEAYGWHATRVEDGNDLEAIAAAIEEARADDRPSLIAIRTHIGFGSPNKQDTQKAHGSPLGPDEVRLVKEGYGWDPDRTFYVPDEAREHFQELRGRGEGLVDEWERRLSAYRDGFSDEADELDRRLSC